ncbi:MAG TPA: arylesterase [Gemmatimonadales bacterium]|nr:arylesterase [Gemmatimonadales bacterium]
MALALAGAALVPLALGACRAGADERREAVAERADSAPAAAGPDGMTADPRGTVVFLGTSLTAGYGLSDPALAYPALIQAKIDSAGLPFRVVNAGVSGETSAGARRRIDWVLRQPVAVLVVETGANDGLRGLPVEELRDNLRAILDRARRQTPPPRLVVVGMEAPPNLGARYTAAFRAVYPEVARAYDAALVPFLLAGVGGIDSLNQGDGLHPTARGQRVIAATVWRTLAPVLQRAARERPAREGPTSEARPAT